MNFGLNARKPDSSEHAEQMEKLQSYEQHDTLHGGYWRQQREEKARDQIRSQSFLAKEHKPSKSKKRQSNLVNPFKGDNFTVRVKGKRGSLWPQVPRQKRAVSTTWRAQCCGVCRVSEPASVYIDKKRSPRRSNMQAARLWGFFLPRSCSSKGERTEGLENSESKRKQFWCFLNLTINRR